MLAGQETEMGSKSTTVTVNEQVAVDPLALVAMQVTVVIPIGKLEPLDGEQITPTEHGSVTTGGA